MNYEDIVTKGVRDGITWWYGDEKTAAEDRSWWDKKITDAKPSSRSWWKDRSKLQPSGKRPSLLSAAKQHVSTTKRRAASNVQRVGGSKRTKETQINNPLVSGSSALGRYRQKLYKVVRDAKDKNERAKADIKGKVRMADDVIKLPVRAAGKGVKDIEEAGQSAVRGLTEIGDQALGNLSSGVQDIKRLGESVIGKTVGRWL